jgi:mono/diheme cytochrome c family protein
MAQQRMASVVIVAAVAGWTAAVSAAEDPLARGRYLVEGVGLCGDCHTPRGERGAPDESRRLQGTRLGFQPIGAMPDWAGDAPPLAGGRAGWTRAQMVEFLSTGVGPSGKPARPPMPPYRLDRADAEAVAAYLESLR